MAFTNVLAVLGFQKRPPKDILSMLECCSRSNIRGRIERAVGAILLRTIYSPGRARSREAVVILLENAGYG